MFQCIIYKIMESDFQNEIDFNDKRQIDPKLKLFRESERKFGK